jgi:hypothetical protein
VSYEYSIFEMKKFKIEVTLVLQYVGTKEFQISRHFTQALIGFALPYLDKLDENPSLYVPC